MLALLVGSQWPAAFVLGWATTKVAWRLLGARPPHRPVNIPVQVDITSGRRAAMNLVNPFRTK